jgi:hypothetical protein
VSDSSPPVTRARFGPVVLAIFSVLLILPIYIWLAQYVTPGEPPSTWVTQVATAPLFGLGLTCLGAYLRSWTGTIVGVLLMWAPLVLFAVALATWRLDSLI